LRERIVGLALGTIHRMDASLAADRDGDRNRLVCLARRYRVDGLELTLGSFGQVLLFRPSVENLRWMRSLAFVSIHGPVFPGCGAPGEAARVLDRLETLYADCGASNIVLHPDGLPDAAWMRGTSCGLSIENLAPSTGFDSERLADVLDAHPQAGLCLDLSHAFSGPEGEAEALLARFGRRLRQVHVSAASGGRTHLRLKHASRELLSAFAGICALGKPCMLEEDLSDPAEVEEDLSILSSLLRGPPARAEAVPT
jgi:hypothetical protein